MIIFLIVLCGMVLGAQDGVCSQEGEQEICQDQTMMLFVGEDIELLSLASRREESASQAPAVADVISRSEIHDLSLTTLSEALDRLPGFYMAQKQWGHLPYLRGMPNSVLFLYDTVPLMSDTSKSLHQLDYEMSLASVKKIEVVRGPSSVLWGPDAFGGVVNVVPLSGQDLVGLEAGCLFESRQEHTGMYLNYGQNFSWGDLFFSVTGREEQREHRDLSLAHFWGHHNNIPVTPDERLGWQETDHDQYIDFSGRVNLWDWLSLSGRYTENEKSYFVEYPAYDFAWEEMQSFPASYIKLEGDKKIDDGAVLRFTGYYSSYRPEFSIVDFEASQREQQVFGELIYERELFLGQGLLTAGGSYRRKQLEDVHLWNSYVPDYFVFENTLVFPLFDTKDYTSHLYSLFGQYRHTYADFDFVFGARGDFHDDYDNQLSLNTGLVWKPNSSWYVKLLLGSAYRSPFSRQIVQRETSELENIKTLTAQIHWSLAPFLQIDLTGFYSQLDDHHVENPLAKLSESNSQYIHGLELTTSSRITNTLKLSTNLTLLDNAGPDEQYRYLLYTRIKPDGTVVKKFEELTYPYDAGPDILANIDLSWQPSNDLFVNLHGHYIGSHDAVFSKGDTVQRIDDAWITDISLSLKDIFCPGLDLVASVENVFDTDYETDGIYTLENGQGLNCEVNLRYSW
jgi:outer membrane receptor for ferrienterochelin and colicin